MDDVEFERRKTAALAAIGQAYGTEGGEDGHPARPVPPSRRFPTR